MPVLSVKTKRDNYRLVGVHLPPRVHNFLTLYTLSKGEAKSNLFKDLIDNWIKEQEELGITEKTLIKDISERVFQEWQLKKKKEPRANYAEFITRLRNELIGKGLTLNQVNKIIPNT